MKWIVPLVLVLGCAAGLPEGAATPQAAHRTALVMAIDTWEAAGLPWGKTCDEELARLKVVVAQPERFTELCLRRPNGAGGRLYACSTYQYERAWPWWLFKNDRVPLLVISALEIEDHRQRLVVHEAMHWLGGCSGKGIDHDHADEFVWQSVMRIAQQRLAQESQPGRYASVNGSQRPAR